VSRQVALRSVGLWGTISVAVGLFVYQTLNLRGYVSSDFHIFYDAAARSVADFSAIYKDGWKADVQKDVATLQGFLYPPPSVLAFVPLVIWDKPEAFAVFSGLAFLAAVVSIWIWLGLLARNRVATPGRTEIATQMLLALVTAPVYLNRGGQVGTFILLFCVLGVALGNGRWGWIGGLLLALGGWIKIYPGLLLLAMPLRNDWRKAAIGFVAAAIAIPLLSLIVIPFDMYQQYFSVLLPAMSGRAIINIDNQSLAAIWLRLQDTGLDPQTSFTALPVPGLFTACCAAGAGAMIAAFAWLTRAAEASFLPVSAVIMSLIGPIAPLGWGHSYAFMLPLLVMVLAIAWQRSAYPALLGAMFAWALIVVPSHTRLPENLLPQIVEQVFYARYPIAVAIMLAALWTLCGNAALKPETERPIYAQQPMEVS
jgi:alpha-1,2-mannosyltransferase